MAKRLHGSTTVAATAYLAHLAGIKIFATGGIGGFHRGAQESLDISADLVEMARTPVAVVCAGAKSILDIGRTLEVLETQGVPVVTYGPNTEFPAFYSPRSGFHSPWQVDTAAGAAELIFKDDQIQSTSGVLIACPIPSEAAKEASIIQQAVETAVKEIELAGTTGKEVTPWLLNRVKELSGGSSVQASESLSGKCGVN